MFSGNPGVGPGGQEVPGIASVVLSLIKNQTWFSPSPGNVYGDAYPNGTQRAIFETDMTITLKGTLPDSDITGFTVNDQLEFHVIPVVVTEEGVETTEYRIWKWKDLSS
jgi:hypothetical protein